LHQLQRIYLTQPLDIDSELVVYKDVTNSCERVASKVEYQRSVVQQIVTAYLGVKATIDHKESGAPFLVEFPEKYISVSHSQDYYAIQFSNEKAVGIDIQIFKKNLAKGKDYFVNDWEAENLEMTELNLHLIWSAKEAIYKQLSGDIEKYREELVIKAIQPSSVEIEVGEKYYFFKSLIELDFILVYS